MAFDLTGQAVDNLLISKISDKIGTIKESMLNPAQFNQENPGVWMLMNGQSCVETAYQALTGQNNVPDMTTEGAFLRQAKSGRAIGSYEGDAIRNITGTAVVASWQGGGTGAMTMSVVGNGPSGSTGNNMSRIDFNASRQVPTSDENRPKNIAVNYYIKVDY